MNAVKRCLGLLVATLVVGACGGDPTAEDAGTGVTIRLTPGVIWVHDNSTASFTAEAIDALGGTMEGSWTISAVTGPVTAELDADYQKTNAGSLGLSSRFNVTPTGAGEGTVRISGTGGDTVIRVRIAPDTAAFNVTFSTTTPAIAEAVTATAPAGLRFTAGTAVAFYDGPLAADLNNGLAAPTVTGMNSDSTQLTFLPAPGAAGNVRFTGIASVSTPTLTTSARSAGTVTVPVLSSFAATFSDAAPAANTAITVTVTDPLFRLRPTSAFTQAGAGLGAWVLSRSADSTSAVIVPNPGFTGTTVTVTALQFSPLASLSLSLPTSATLTVPAIDLGNDDPEAGAVPTLNAPATIGAANAAVYWDAGSFTAADYSADGGDFSQHYLISFPAAGTYNISTNWSGASDIDAVLVPNNGNYGAPDGSEWEAFSAGSSKPEAFNYVAAGAETWLFMVIDWSGDHTATARVRIVITRTS